MTGDNHDSRDSSYPYDGMGNPHDGPSVDADDGMFNPGSTVDPPEGMCNPCSSIDPFDWIGGMVNPGSSEDSYLDDEMVNPHQAPSIDADDVMVYLGFSFDHVDGVVYPHDGPSVDADDGMGNLGFRIDPADLADSSVHADDGMLILVISSILIMDEMVNPPDGPSVGADDGMFNPGSTVDPPEGMCNPGSSIDPFDWIGWEVNLGSSKDSYSDDEMVNPPDGPSVHADDGMLILVPLSIHSMDVSEELLLLASLSGAKIYRKAGVQQLKEGWYPQFVTEQPLVLPPEAACIASKDVTAAVDVYIMSVGSNGLDPGSVLEVQSKAVRNRARDRAGDKLQYGSERPEDKLPTAKVQGAAKDIQKQKWSLTHP
ncbi:hypothetical protein BTVI_30664 [Pitangus sulphuratus]|nr:hypothetical protein BTVI_30664 [Pitangus sulphuratus]